MSYSTGELAELCGTTVRTVQFYDREGLLKPDGFSEGGRRLYNDESLKTLRIILMYRGLGLSLKEIRSVLSAETDCRKILLSVLTERERALDEDIRKKLSSRESIAALKTYLAEGRAMSPNTFLDVQTIMKGKRKLKATYAVMLAVGIALDLAQIAFIVLWAVKGIWLPFAIGMPLVVAVCVLLIAVYYKNVQYVCSSCGMKFKPKVREWFFSYHTPTAHKLTCPYCKVKTFHTETYSD